MTDIFFTRLLIGKFIPTVSKTVLLTFIPGRSTLFRAKRFTLVPMRFRQCSKLHVCLMFPIVGHKHRSVRKNLTIIAFKWQVKSNSENYRISDKV